MSPETRRAEREKKLADKLAKAALKAARKGHSRGRVRGVKGKHVDGKWFASTAEADRYEQLKIMQAAGQIEELECQVRYDVRISNVLICFYLADFRYKVVDDLGRCVSVVVEDVKGMITDIYKLKRKMVQAAYGFTIQEIPSKKVHEWAGRTP